jgi:predicted TIM-barrel fold metal-dependent hydrolase
MDEAGIETAILLPIDFGFSMGEVTIPIEVQNEEIARVALTHTDRFFPFIGIDPRRKGAMDLLKRGVEEWGVRGIKYHGIGEFFPGEELGLPLLEWAEKKNLILLIHQGPLMNPFESKYTHPQFLEPVLKMFPNLRVVAAHMAFGWWRELINLAQKYPLLYTDISGWQLVALDNTPQFIHILRRIIDGMGNDHVLFGTDGPTFDPFFSKRAFISLIKNLIKGGSPPFFSENEINALLKGNAHRLMREK